MSYQALARKWRPWTFEQVVGQEHVVQALTHALDQDRLHHAYLFCGTRGVGKTTLARILARCLNCESGISSRPCGECDACQAIGAGRFVDLIEVDAASRTRVDDTRELLDNVPYAPARGRFKVYIIDEVHMLSTSSFNALLKTLEEPPEHVKFLFATTDPQRLPLTVLSRCVQFNLHRLPAGDIETQLRVIADAEAIEVDEQALLPLAYAADGSLRDALSLMDQAIAFGGGRLRGEDVARMLGALDRGAIVNLAERIAEGDGTGMLATLEQLLSGTPEPAQVLDALSDLFQRVAVHQIVPDAKSTNLLPLDRIERLADRLTPEQVQLFYQIALAGKRDLPYAPEPRSGVEMACLRMLAFRPYSEDLGKRPTGTSKRAARTPAAHTAPAKRAAVAERQEHSSTKVYEARSNSSDSTAEPGRNEQRAHVAEGRDPDWDALVPSLQLHGMAAQLAENCAYVGREGVTIRLRLDPKRQQLLTSRLANTVQGALRRFYQEPQLKVRIECGTAGPAETPAARGEREAAKRQDEAVEALEADPNVKALRDTFDAEILRDTIHPID